MKRSKQSLEFRSLSPSDLPQILEIEHKSFPHPWSAEGFGGVVANDLYLSLGVFRERLMGYIIAIKVLDELHILNIAVAPDCRRNGVGGLLMDATMKVLDGKIRTIFLEVRQSNLPAINFYRKRGFKTVGRRKNYYPDGEDAILMILKSDMLK